MFSPIHKEHQTTSVWHSSVPFFAPKHQGVINQGALGFFVSSREILAGTLLQLYSAWFFIMVTLPNQTLEQAVKKLPSWVSYVAPDQDHNGLPPSFRRKKRPLSNKKTGNHENDASMDPEVWDQYHCELLMQQDIIKTRLYHGLCQRLDQLVQDFFTSSFAANQTTVVLASNAATTTRTTGSETSLPTSTSKTTKTSHSPSSVHAAESRQDTVASTAVNHDSFSEKYPRNDIHDMTLESTTTPSAITTKSSLSSPKTTTTHDPSHPATTNVDSDTAKPSTVPVDEVSKSQDVGTESLNDPGTNKEDSRISTTPVQNGKGVGDNNSQNNTSPPTNKKRQLGNDLQPQKEQSCTSWEAFQKRYRMNPVTCSVSQHEQQQQQAFPDEAVRLVLPVTIVPQTMAPLQHGLDRWQWMHCWVHHHQRRIGVAAVVWLQQPPTSNPSPDWPKEELIRQLWKAQPPSVSYSRKHWSKMTLSELLQNWARYYQPREDHHGTKKKTEDNQKTIYIVWDPQTCPIHGQFWMWLVEQRCQYGVPLSVVLLEDVVQTRIFHNHQPPHRSSTLPASCAAHVHIESAKPLASHESGSHSSPPRWLDRLLEFGMSHLNHAARKTSDMNDSSQTTEETALRVVLHWLLHRRESKKRQLKGNDNPFFEEQLELMPLLLHWKKEWATELSKVSIAFNATEESTTMTKSDGWFKVAHDVLDLAPSGLSGDSFRGELMQRLRYIDLLRQKLRPNPLHHPTASPYALDCSCSWLAFQLKQLLQSLDNGDTVQTTENSPLSSWTEGHRQQILAWLLQQRKEQKKQLNGKALTTNDKEDGPTFVTLGILDCIHEWMILLDHSPSRSEFQQCVDEYTMRSASHGSDMVTDDGRPLVVTQLRRETVSSLFWDQEKQMPDSLIDTILDSDEKTSQRLLSQWAIRVAPAALYQGLADQASISDSEWYQEFGQRLLSHVSESLGQSMNDIANRDWLSPAYHYGVHHLRHMGLVKEQRRTNGTVYEKIALVFCSGD